MRYKKGEVNYNKTPFVEMDNPNYKVEKGWNKISEKLNQAIEKIGEDRKIIVIETYQGVIHEEVMKNLREKLRYDTFISVEDYMFSPDKIKSLVKQDVTDDRIFGYRTRLTIADFYDLDKVSQLTKEITETEAGTIVLYGTGASFVWPDCNLLVYLDMARWEIQLRMRKHLVDNIGVKNRNTEDWRLLYKQGFFVDWLVCDRLKKKLYDKWDFVIDTNKAGQSKMVEGKAVLEGISAAIKRPFSVVPYFDSGVWGGQWMKEVFDLNKEAVNYAWSFNCVLEENSLLLKFGDDFFEIPSVNVVYRHPVDLLGDPVHARFGDNFPIRFDYLDTMEGGNLSLQVHPLTEYVQEKFGMHYTQDESYYFMDASEGAVAYLGFKENINSEDFIKDLKKARDGGDPFDAGKYVQTFPVKKHDHFAIPAGTIHCQGTNSMVLEISATPYLFTFKLWDWGRLGLDGKPRPINIEHGKNVLQWNRTTSWTEKNLINNVKKIAEGDDWREESTGLHKREFIETRRHWFSKKTVHHTSGSVNVICMVEGDEIVIESPDQLFEPFIIHYGEVFVVPAAVEDYTISPYGSSVGKTCATIKAFVRF